MESIEINAIHETGGLAAGAACMADDAREMILTDDDVFGGPANREGGQADPADGSPDEASDLMHKFAQTNGLPYGESWREFERLFYNRHRIKVSYMKWSYCQNHQIKITMPVFLEMTQRLDQALAIAHEMTGNMLRGGESQ
jgi:hypothetical protein